MGASRRNAVFEGVARGAQTPAPGVVDPATHVPAVKQTFTVVRRWKGEVPPSVDVFNAERDSSCGRAYADGARFVIYIGRDDGGRFWDSSCSRTRDVAAASEDLAALGPGSAPSPAPDGGAGIDMAGGAEGATTGGCSLAPRAALDAGPGLLALVALALVVRRRGHA